MQPEDGEPTSAGGKRSEARLSLSRASYGPILTEKAGYPTALVDNGRHFYDKAVLRQLTENLTEEPSARCGGTC